MGAAKHYLVLIFLMSLTPGQYAAAFQPDDNPFGPGDRPSICLERAREDITSNLKPMTKIAKALMQSSSVDEVGLLRYSDGSSEIVFMAEREQVEQSAKTTSRFTSLFDKLPGNYFTPWHFAKNEEVVIAYPGVYNPGIFIMNSGPWCGGTDEAWKAEVGKEFYVGVNRGGPIFYAFYPDSITLQRACSDDAFISERNGYCDLGLSKNWAIVFQYSNEFEPK